MSIPEIPPATLAALAKLAQAISDPDLRKSFTTDPVATLERVGANVSDIPERVFTAVTECSYQELELVSRCCETLVEAGLYVEAPDGGRLCIL